MPAAAVITITFREFLFILAMLETPNGVPRDLGTAQEIGPLQITPILVEDVHRYAPQTQDIQHRDCWDWENSIVVAEAYYREWGTPLVTDLYRLTEDDVYVMAKLWRGGPDGNIVTTGRIEDHARRAKNLFYGYVYQNSQ